MTRTFTNRRHLLACGLALSATPALAFGETTMIKSGDGRSVRVSIWPAAGIERGVILFSHGALSAPEKYERLLTPWSQAGFKILAPLHVDSTDHPDHAKFGMVDSWRCRLLDMRALSTFSNASRYVAAGHSYGALTALTLGGGKALSPQGVEGPLRDPRATSVVAFSPPGGSTLMTVEGYSHLAVPALIETGTRDNPPASMGASDWRTHLDAFNAAPDGLAYALVLDGADHYFGGLICEMTKPGPPQLSTLAKGIEVSTDFLKAYGLADASALERLQINLSSHHSSYEGYQLTIRGRTAPAAA